MCVCVCVCAVAMSSSGCLLLCLTIFLLSLTAVNSKRSLTCCLKTSKDKIPKGRVMDYIIQTTGVCPINAIVLLVKPRQVKCIDPDSDWIKGVIQMVDQRKRASPKQKGNGKNRKGNKKKKQKKGGQ